MTYEEWEGQVPAWIKKEPVWKFFGYRKALFLHDLAWLDTEAWMKDPRGRRNASQLIESAGPISANLEEGYGRGTGSDKRRFYVIALGSARETKGWYYRGRRFLSTAVLEHRLTLADEIIALLVNEVSLQTQHLRSKA